jgi:hypothetical protein
MIINDLFSKKQGIAEGGIATVGWPDEDNSTRNNTPVSVGGTFDARPVVKRGSLVKASGLTGVFRVMDILRDEAKIVQEIPRTGQSTYVPMSDLRVWTNKPIKEQGMAEGQLELNTPDPVVVVQDQQGKILDKINLSVAAQKYKLGQPQNIKNQLAHQNYTKIGNYTIVSPMTGQPQDATTQGVAEGQTDYQKRRQRERDVDAGKPVKPEPKNPQNDYFARRKKEKEQDMAEGMWDQHQSIPELERAIENLIMGYKGGINLTDKGRAQLLLSINKGKRILAAKKKQQQDMAEASLGDYRKKAALSKATSQIDRFFGRDDPAKVAAADQTIAKRERGLARADARTRPYTPPTATPADLEKQQRDLTAKYPNIDELVRRAELNRDPDYEMADGQAYYAARDAEQNYQKLRQIQRVIQGLNESLDRSHLP